jgi:hypothetical protein
MTNKRARNSRISYRDGRNSQKLGALLQGAATMSHAYPGRRMGLDDKATVNSERKGPWEYRRKIKDRDQATAHSIEILADYS